MLFDDGSTAAEVLKNLFQKIFKDYPCELTVTSTMPDKYDMLLVPDTLDMIVARKLEFLFANQPLFEHPSNVRQFLATISEEEITAYAIIHKLQLKLLQKNDLAKSLEWFEQKYPGTKASLIKSLKELKI